MSDNKTCDIDTLLQDTWLVVISLRHGSVFKEGDGQRLWQRCVDNLERVQQHLMSANYSAESCQHILYAQCALLDEAAKSRGVQDDACIQWYDKPLQGQFFGNLNAGDQLYERMRQVLREAAPDIAVLTCFHRVLMLGFLGGFDCTDVPERARLVRELSDRVPAFSAALSHAVLAPASAGLGAGAWLRHWPVRIGLSALSLAALWWGLDHWLDNLVATLLPGGMR
ncbi:DotU family type IV/VI secretion system protein [Chimaeribacter californicus]|uniref:DotU family type IV/VI secretion system protein n=1 Tax=Chimaeribacter californicus TaxID=2060067 RepID=A0A2N5EE70_9GAMM|nr:type VI secretion system protein TssL, short form [Chimaeribacter californicus]PLR40824.1 DotU family type IV/VI secretion system protein [Chimaeribacter californicus]